MYSSRRVRPAASARLYVAVPKGISRYACQLCLLALMCAFSPSASAQLGLMKVFQPKAAGKPDQASSKPTAAAVPASDSQPAQTATDAIPLPDVAMRAQQLNQTLREITSSLPSAEQIADVSDAIEQNKQEIDTKRKETDALLQGTPSTIELREQENYWRALQSNNLAWGKQLLDWANTAQAAVNELEKQEPLWTATLEEHKKETALGQVLELLKGNVESIRKLRTQEVAVLQQVVKMQIDNNTLEQESSDTLNRLMQARIAFQSKLFYKDSLPIWNLAQRRQAGEAPPLFKTASARWIAIRTFLRNDRVELMALFVFLLIGVAVAHHVRERVNGLSPADPVQAEAVRIMGSWVAVGVLPAILLAYLLAPQAPIGMLGGLILLSCFPILKLLPPTMHPAVRALLYCLVVLYGASFVIGWMSLPPVYTRELQFLVSSSALAVFVWLVRGSRLRGMARSSRGAWWLVLLVRCAVGVLLTSLLFNAFGYVKFAQFLSVACVYSAFMAICIVTGVRIFGRLLVAGVQSSEGERLAIVRLHRPGLLRWIPRLLRWTGALAWLAVALDLFNLRDLVMGKIDSSLKFQIAGEGSGVTVGSLFGFLLIVAIGYMIASAIRFVLREEVLGRFNMARGVPELIASTVYYLLLLLVFLSAVNAGGVQLNKFTVLTGALGVGVGFGLQNIINNFVSGLILQFERPIHIKDVLEVDGQTGTVTRIGIRSSTLQTAQGAEVIIPNASLISGKVTNWTLTEAKRRAELPVGVAYGTDPDAVIKILLKAANMHESVLTNPPPAAYFKGFGDSSLDFELQFWVMQDSNWIRVKSDIGRLVMKWLDEAKIEVPFPQRDLHLRSVDATAKSLFTLDGAKNGAGEKTGDDVKAKGTVAD